MPTDDELMDKYYDDMDKVNKFRDSVTTGKKIIEAVKENNVEEVRRLVSLPVDEGGLILFRYTETDENGKTALQIAEENGYIEIIEILKPK